MERIRCGECKWWDLNTDYDGKGKWRKCSNPMCPGFNYWREYKNHICKGYGEPIIPASREEGEDG